MTRRGIKIAVLSAGFMATLTFGLTVGDAARTIRHASHISITSDGLTFTGRVTSSKSLCEVDRSVTVYRTNGDVLGSTTTGASGHWRITAPGSAGITLGHFYAKVKELAWDNPIPPPTIDVCKAARSATIPFHQ